MRNTTDREELIHLTTNLEEVANILQKHSVEDLDKIICDMRDEQTADESSDNHQLDISPCG